MLLTIFRCAPIDTQWAFHDSETDCHFGTYQLFVGSSTPHIVTDVVLLGIPMPLIWKLHLHSSRKVILTAIYALGILYIALFFVSFHNCTAGAEAKTGFSR